MNEAVRIQRIVPTTGTQWRWPTSDARLISSVRDVPRMFLHERLRQAEVLQAPEETTL